MGTEKPRRPMVKADYERIWDYEADVVVLGGGMAGCAAAIELDILGADLLMLEKAPEKDVGGGARVSGQSMLQVGSDSVKLMEYQRNLNKPKSIPEDILETWADSMTRQTQWIVDRAAEVGYTYKIASQRHASYPEMPGSEIIEGIGRCDPSNPTDSISGAPLPAGSWGALWMNVKKRGIKVMFETPAIELVQDLNTREILGVIAEQAGKRIYVKARKAVILCIGGFEANEEMLADFYGIANVCNLGSPYNTGDGMKMLIKVGADLWHLRNPTVTSGLWVVFKVPGHAPFFRNIGIPKWSWIEVAKDGTRYNNEAYNWILSHMRMSFHGTYIDHPLVHCAPAFFIFDEEVRKSTSLVTSWMGWEAIMEGYKWSDDNSVEVDKGWITKADSIADLAVKLGIDGKNLEQTVKNFNMMAEAGQVDELGREPDKMTPLKKPPYYGITIWPAVVTTTGGGRRDKKARVLDVDGNPIPRLYEAGELGSTIANLYQNGTFLAECIVFGRIAAQNAVAELPWC